MTKSTIPISIVREMEVAKSVGGVWHVWAGDDTQVSKHGDTLQLRRFGRVVSEWEIPATGEKRVSVNRLFKELEQHKQVSPRYAGHSGGKAA